MGDWPTTLLPPLPTITTASEEAYGVAYTWTGSGSPTSQTLTANQAYFQPFRIDVGMTAVKMCYVVGATAAGNVDLGIYDAEFNLLVSSGATAQGTINTLQELDITDTVLRPGSYWMAISASIGTATAFASPVVDETSVPALAMYMQATAHPLPTPTATPVKNTEGSPRVVALAISFDTLI